MANIDVAYNSIRNTRIPFNNIDYFFTQRTLIEDEEYIDTNMNRQIKKKKVTNNFIAINIPIHNNNSLDFDVEIFGDEGYYYKGNIKSFQGIMPGFIILIKGDKKLFIHIDYKYNDENDNIISKKFVNFIEVPKRFQFIEIVDFIEDVKVKKKNNIEDNNNEEIIQEINEELNDEIHEEIIVENNQINLKKNKKK